MMVEQGIRFLWTITVQSSVLIAVIILIRTLFKNKIDKRLQYALWLPVLLRLLMPLSFEGAFGVMNAVRPLTEGIERSFTLSQAGQQPVMATAGDAAAQTASLPPAQTASVGGFPWSEVIFCTWLVGAIIAVAVTIWVNVRFSVSVRKMRASMDTFSLASEICAAQGIERTPQICVSSRIGSPCVVGILRPCIILTPSALSNQKALKYILLHELTHIRRCDNIIALLRVVCCSVYWYNPLVWAAGYLSHRDCELACDASVTLHLSTKQKQEYGMALISQLTRGTKPFAVIQTAATLTMGKKEMPERIKMIMNNKKTAKWVCASIALLLCAVIPLTACVSRKQSINSVSPSDADLQSAAESNVELLLDPSDDICFEIRPVDLHGRLGYYLPDESLREQLRPMIAALRRDDIHEDMRDYCNDHQFSGISICCNGETWAVYSDGLLVGRNFAAGIYNDMLATDTELSELVLKTAREELGMKAFFDPTAIKGIVSATYDYTYALYDVNEQGEYIERERITDTQTVTDSQTLGQLEKLLNSGEDLGIGGAGCSFDNILTVTLEDNTAFRFCVATDSCGVFMIDGRYFSTDIPDVATPRIHDYFDKIPAGTY